jgi:hypothetical protein
VLIFAIRKGRPAAIILTPLSTLSLRQLDPLGCWNRSSFANLSQDDFIFLTVK